MSGIKQISRNPHLAKLQMWSWLTAVASGCLALCVNDGSRDVIPALIVVTVAFLLKVVAVLAAYFAAELASQQREQSRP